MAEWKDAFSRAISCFRSQQYEQALANFSEAISLGGKDPSVYDSRAAVYEKLGRKKEALLDSKQVIYLAPDLWKGYARAARLFHSAHKHDSASKMINLALERIRPEDGRRFAELDKLRQDIVSAGEADLEYRHHKARQTFYHFGKLPLELAIAIFRAVLEEDVAYVVIMAQVSREWRSVILGTPILWDTLVLTTRNPARKAKIWKERSQGRLRKLDLRDGDMKIVWALNEFHSMSLRHLRELTLKNVRADHFFKMLPTCASVLSSLEYLRLEGLLGQKDTLRFTEESGSQLRHLIARDALVHWPLLADNCRQLRTLAYETRSKHPNPEDLLWLLHSNPQLESLELSLHHSTPHDVLVDFSVTPVPRALPEHVSLPVLTKLVLCGGGFGMPHTHILSSATFPSLRILHLSRLTEHLDNVLDHLSTSGSLSRLSNVRIDGCIVRSSGTLLRLLEIAADVEALQLSRLNFVNTAFEALATPTPSTDGGQPKVCCPKLSHVEVTYCPDVKTGPVVRLVKLHNSQASQVDSDGNNAVSKITTLVLDGCHIENDSLPWLRQHVPALSCVYQTRKEAKWKR